MSRAAKIWLIVGAVLVVAGSVTFAAAMTAYGWDFTKLNTARYEKNTYELEGKISDIAINVDTDDIAFVPLTEGKSRIECVEREDAKHLVKVTDGRLNVALEDNRKWYEGFFGLFGGLFNTPKLIVYIPEGEYGELSINSHTGDAELPNAFRFKSIDVSNTTGAVKNSASASGAVKIKTSTGDILVAGISADSVELSATTGDIVVSDVACSEDITIGVSTGRTDLYDISCSSLYSDGSTGYMTLNRVVASKKLTVERSTGSVYLDRCDASELSVKTNTGDIRGSLLSDKVFITNTVTGHVDVPASSTGGKCELNTGTGDINITIAS